MKSTPSMAMPEPLPGPAPAPAATPAAAAPASLLAVASAASLAASASASPPLRTHAPGPAAARRPGLPSGGVRRIRQTLAALLMCTLGAVLLPSGARAQDTEGRTYAPGPFQHLEIAGSARLRLVQGPRDQVFIAGDAELLQDVRVELHDDRLLIRPAGSWKFWNSQRLQVDVSMRQPRQIVISGAADLRAVEPVHVKRLAIHIAGAGQVRFDDLEAEQLSFGISGAGEGLLRGRVKDLNLQITGKGKLQAEQFLAEQATVAISGIGQAQLWVRDELRLSVSGVGTVEYWGAPEVKRRTSGLARVNALGEKPAP